MSVIRSLLSLVLLTVLAGCASVPNAQRRNDRQAAYLAAAGSPVSDFTFSSLYSWEPLSEKQLVVYTRPTQAWLLDLFGCPGLLYSNSIGLTSNLNQVSARFDKVLTQRGYIPCTISQIRPVDVKRMRAVVEEKRQIRSEPRSAPVDSAAH